MRTTTTRTSGRRLAVCAAAVLFVLTACSGGGGDKKGSAQPGGGGAFAPAPASATCQEHQSQDPGADYTSAEEGDTAKVFELLRHYTANGLKPYCDGKGPTALDKTWAELFLGFGADPALIAPELGGNGQPPGEPMEDPEAAEAPAAG
ncbi:hypothetical protein [Yinghuangia soli]|uniref:Lipoprotein n=1 Tax=Yinghuangia soli TaxID=2908204 RepID=A0AA41U307_9ACTN|nr:hypothetical protein [Yinghuangia soli]MCF2529217.1 hypothetical protein [Yinghuangia soli]